MANLVGEYEKVGERALFITAPDRLPPINKISNQMLIRQKNDKRFSSLEFHVPLMNRFFFVAFETDPVLVILFPREKSDWPFS